MMFVGDPTLATIKTVIATGVAADTWFEVTCPDCGMLTLTSLYTREGELCDCDACLGGYWFEAGDFWWARKTES